MRRRAFYAVVSVVAISAVALGQSTVTLTLNSAQDGQVVPAGATVDWTIIFSASGGDNENLAPLSIPPADGVPAEMTRFSRPDGICNPGETDPSAACGVYTLAPANPVANVLVERNEPPAFSPVTEAAVGTAAGSISFTVTLLGDLDLDGDVDLTDLAQLLANYGTPSGMTYSDGDLDGNEDVDLSDLATLLSNYGRACE